MEGKVFVHDVRENHRKGFDRKHKHGISVWILPVLLSPYEAVWFETGGETPDV